MTIGEVEQPKTSKHPKGFTLSRWKSGVTLAILLFVYTLNYSDRVLVSAIGEAIRADLALNDSQLGLLGGIAFALFYAVMGIPLARLAERYNRVKLISVTVVLWSAATAVCGVATNFWQLLLGRVGVGVGEAGFFPSVMSLISDCFPPHRRASAYSVVVLAVPLGSAIGAAGGAWIAQAYGWRAAFLILGAIGLPTAALAWLSLPEPPRGFSENRIVAETTAPPLTAVLRALVRKPSFIYMTAASGLLGFGLFGMNLFLVPLLVRLHGLSIGEAGSVFAGAVGIASAIGIGIGGVSVDTLGRRDLRWYLWLPAIALVLSTPVYVAGLLQSDRTAMISLIFIGSIAFYSFLPTTTSITMSLVEPRMRASTTAIHNLGASLFGMGLGPLTLGVISDRLSQRAFGSSAYSTLCSHPALAAAGRTQCQSAAALGLQQSLLICASVFLASALMFVLAARHYRSDIDKG